MLTQTDLRSATHTVSAMCSLCETEGVQATVYLSLRRLDIALCSRCWGLSHSFKTHPHLYPFVEVHSGDEASGSSLALATVALSTVLHVPEKVRRLVQSAEQASPALPAANRVSRSVTPT